MQLNPLEGKLFLSYKIAPSSSQAVCGDYQNMRHLVLARAKPSSPQAAANSTASGEISAEEIPASYIAENFVFWRCVEATPAQPEESHEFTNLEDIPTHVAKHYRDASNRFKSADSTSSKSPSEFDDIFKVRLQDFLEKGKEQAAAAAEEAGLSMLQGFQLLQKITPHVMAEQVMKHKLKYDNLSEKLEHLFTRESWKGKVNEEEGKQLEDFLARKEGALLWLRSSILREIITDLCGMPICYAMFYAKKQSLKVDYFVEQGMIDLCETLLPLVLQQKVGLADDPLLQFETAIESLDSDTLNVVQEALRDCFDCLKNIRNELMGNMNNSWMYYVSVFAGMTGRRTKTEDFTALKTTAIALLLTPQYRPDSDIKLLEMADDGTVTLFSEDTAVMCAIFAAAYIFYRQPTSYTIRVLEFLQTCVAFVITEENRAAVNRRALTGASEYVDFLKKKLKEQENLTVSIIDHDKLVRQLDEATHRLNLYHKSFEDKNNQIKANEEKLKQLKSAKEHLTKNCQS